MPPNGMSWIFKWPPIVAEGPSVGCSRLFFDLMPRLRPASRGAPLTLCRPHNRQGCAAQRAAEPSCVDAFRWFSPSLIVLPSPRVRASRDPRTSLVPGIHRKRQGVCRGSWMAGPKPGHDNGVIRLSGSKHSD
jgi:hypothetical protein